MLAAPSQTDASPGQLSWQRGVALLEASKWADAAQAFDCATKEEPGEALFWINLANALRHQGDLEAAEQAVRRALTLQPTNALALSLLAECLARLHRHGEALRVFQSLAAAGDDDPDVMVRHGATLLALLQPQAAAAVLLKALGHRPADVAGHALLANAMADMELGEEAVECIKTALALAPWHLEMLVRLCHQKRMLCDWTDFDLQLKQIEFALQRLSGREAGQIASFSLLSLPLAPELHLPAVAQDVRARAGGIQPMPTPATGSASLQTERRIRVGLLSYDFRQHPVSQLLVEVLEQLDRSRLEVVLYCIGFEDGSALRQRIKATADRFVSLDGLSDAGAAQRIRDDGIEILIDLMGVTRGARLPILAHRPAPVQVGFLGFPGSLASPLLDYIVGDAVVTPLALAPLYAEKLAQMPRCFLPNGRLRPLPQPMSRSEAGLPEEAFVMAAFHQHFKILPHSFDVWCDVMRRVPHAVLWLRDGKSAMRANLQREAAARGIAPHRLVFAPRVDAERYFSRLALADVFVDCWPYNAHTTAADALWAGVPVVTLAGNSFASRVAASVLDAAGLGDLAFMSVDDYRMAIVALAKEPGLLQSLKSQLVQQRQSMTLFDSAGYARDFTELLARMSGAWRNGQAFDHLLAPSPQG